MFHVHVIFHTIKVPQWISVFIKIKLQQECQEVQSASRIRDTLYLL
jgi:hypothetical protein